MTYKGAQKINLKFKSTFMEFIFILQEDRQFTNPQELGSLRQKQSGTLRDLRRSRPGQVLPEKAHRNSAPRHQELRMSHMRLEVSQQAGIAGAHQSQAR